MTEKNSHNLLLDPYFTSEYVDLYVRKKNLESIFSFNFSINDQWFKSISIKRPINKISDKTYFDLESAYGYGGYITNSSDINFLKIADEALVKRMQEESIIAEFIRWHPMTNLVKADLFGFNFLSLDRQTISIDLAKNTEERWREYSSTTRNIIRKAQSSLKFEETVDLDSFIHFYYQTMDKNGANPAYYFPREYFEKLLAKPFSRLFVIKNDNCIVNMSFFLVGEVYAHYHLSANNLNFVNLGGNYFLMESACKYLQKNHPSVVELHLGGGRTNAPDDQLLMFKKKFSKLERNFFITGRIINKDVYSSLNKFTSGSKFLAYRESV